MRCRTSAIVGVVVVLASCTLPARSLAQPANPGFASDYLIVKVVEGVEPAVLPDGSLALTYGQDVAMPAPLVMMELLIADLLEGCGATTIEPMLRVELELNDRARFCAARK